MSTNGRAVVASGTALTTSGQTGPLTLSSSSATRVDLMGTIAAVSGTTPSITFGIAWDGDSDRATWPVATYNAASTGSARTSTGSDLTLASATKTRVTTNEPRYFRVSWTVTGTSPSFTLADLWIVES